MFLSYLGVDKVNIYLHLKANLCYLIVARIDRFNHDMNISAGGDDTDDTDDLPVFGSFGSYSPQYKKQNSNLNQCISTPGDDMFVLNYSQSSSVSSGKNENTSGFLIKTPSLRKLDVNIFIVLFKLT